MDRNEDNLYTLNADEIMAFDEVQRDRDAAKATLNIALSFHHNTENDIMKREGAMWDHVLGKAGLEKKGGYATGRINGVACIVAPEEIKDE